MYDAFEEQRKAKERAEKDKAIEGSLSPWLRDSTGKESASVDTNGYIRPGPPTPQPKVHWEDLSNTALQGDQRTPAQWAKTAEGKQAIAEDTERHRPKPKLEKRGDVWRYTSTRGERWEGPNRLRLLEKVVFGDQSAEQLTAGMKEFLATHKDYTPDPFVWGQMVEWLAEQEFFCTSQALALAWRAIKSEVKSTPREIASHIIEEIRSTEDERQRAEFSKLTDQQLESAMASVAQAKKQGLI